MKKVLILFGGNSYEHFISCKSVKNVIINIDKKLFDYEVVGISHDNKWYKFNGDLSYLENGNWLDSDVILIDNIINYLKHFDIVFPIIHGHGGEDGNIQGLLEMFDIKYVGSNTCSSALCMDKSISKTLFNSMDIPQLDHIVINNDYKVKNIITKLGFPMIVKPARGGSSIGINKANNKRELLRAIREAKKYDNKIIVEKFIKARELECAILGNKSLVCSELGEINCPNDFYDYDSKYINNCSYKTIPSDLPSSVIEQIKDLAVKTFFLMECKDFARIDFLYDEANGCIYLNEINTIPDFSETGMYPKLIKNENISYTELISMLINNA